MYIAKNNVHSLGTFNGIGNAQAVYSILNDLKFTTKMGLQYLTLNEYQYDNPFHGDGLSANGRSFASYAQYFLTDWTNQLDYHLNLTANKDLVVNAKLGYESILSKSSFITANAQNFGTSRLDLSAVAFTPTAGNINGSDYAFASIYSNLSLNYKDKYILSGNFRRDGSSRFSPANLYATFPSVGIAWNISKEDFLAGAGFLSNLKLRASYGSSGNAETGNYAYLQQLGFNNSVTLGTGYNSQPGGVFNAIGNVNLTWEKDQQSNIGLDASFFNNRLNLVFDYYEKINSQLLFNYPLSQTVGFSGITQNVGKLSNIGEEFTVNATPVLTRNFNWELSLNFSHNKNAIKTLPPGQTQIVNGQFLVAPGYDINTWYMREWVGVDQATGNPLWFTDATRKAVTTNYNAAARVNTGKSANPKFYGGFSNTFTYKGFSLSADLYYSFGSYVWDQWALYLADEVNPGFGKYSLIKQRWQKAGDKTNVPKLVFGSSNFSNSVSTRYLERADYIRLRNISIGYTLGSDMAKRMHLASLRIYVRATNLWTKTFSNNLTIDPEQGGSSNFNGNNGSTTTANVGINTLNLFYNKALTAGLSIGF